MTALSAKDIEQSVWKQACFGELEGLKLLVEVLSNILDCYVILLIYSLIRLVKMLMYKMKEDLHQYVGQHVMDIWLYYYI